MKPKQSPNQSMTSTFGRAGKAIALILMVMHSISAVLRRAHSINIIQQQNFAPSIGNQCTCTALIALCEFCAWPPSFNVNELDDILMKGDELYLEMGANGYLSFDDLPNVVTNGSVGKMEIEQLKPSYVHCNKLNST
jgi:hypothetical protein